MFKLLRITVLLAILAWAAFYTKIQQLEARSWSETLPIVVYPINGDNGNANVEDYLADLADSDYAAIDAFIKQQSEGYDVTETPTATRLGAKIDQLPPEPPMPGASPAEAVLWSLKLRYWVWRHTPDSASNLHRVRVFAIYHEPAPGRALQHSVGINNGLVAIAHLFASEQQTAQNNVVLTHEILHTVGATDKYDADNQPVYPAVTPAPNKSRPTRKARRKLWQAASPSPKAAHKYPPALTNV